MTLFKIPILPLHGLSNLRMGNSRVTTKLDMMVGLGMWKAKAHVRGPRRRIYHKIERQLLTRKKGSTTNTVSFVPGSDIITVEGFSKIAFYFKFVNKHWYKSNDTKTSE